MTVDGQRVVFLSTYAVFTLMHLGGALGHNTATILSTRLLAGTFGSSRMSRKILCKVEFSNTF